MKTKLTIALLVLSILLCAGCGGQVPKEEQGKLPQGPAVTMREDGSSIYLRVDQTISLEIEDPEGFTNKTVYSGSYGSALYLLAEYQFEGDAEPAMWMYTFDLNTQETVKSSFSLEMPDMENLHMYAMAVTGENELTFRLYGSVGGNAASAYLCRTDLTGKLLDEENPIMDDNGYPPDTGRFFAIPDGTCILAEAGEAMTGSLYRYDAQSQTPTALATVNGVVTALCSDGQDGLYYVNSEQLRYLNLADMTDERVFNTAEYGISLTFDNWLLCDKEGRLAICAVNADNPVVYLLTDQEETIEREEIRMVRIGNYCPLFWRADEWSAKSDAYRIVKEEIPLEEEHKTNLVSEIQQMREPLRTRTMAELASGQGPELMIVTKDDMHILAEKGALMDLSELIPEDIQEQLLPGVRQIGTVDGQWVGITDQAFYYTLMTADSLWSGDNWTMSEMLDLADSRDDWGDWILSYSWIKPDYNWLFEWGFATSIGDSPFMDMENGISYFNSEEFIRALEFCKKHGQPSNVETDNEGLYQMLLEEKSLAEVVYLYDGLHSFSKKMAANKGCHMVGFPNESGSGNYMYADSYLVVNADAEHVDAISDYISYLLDYETQFGSTNPVRRDAIRDQVGDDPDIYPTPYTLAYSTFQGDYYPWPLEDLKPDGTTYLEEYLDFVESCKAVPYCPDAITNIVKEEIGAYFAGNKSAKDTADIIHRRVQLYFDER